MSSKPINQIKETIRRYEYDDEFVVAIDFSMTANNDIHAEKIDNLLIVSYTHPQKNETSIEFELPDAFTDPDITVKNGIITVTQPKDSTPDTETDSTDE